mmetsp:Transcript_20505/g.43601  ORF Transcript_20505/g.43601 Transcript_20505/m.43601 type:complete len:297 (+) Transcript_20505:309-1199(+)
MRGLGVEDQRGEIEASSILMMAEVGVRNCEVGPAPSVVRLQLEALVVGDHGLLALPRVGKSGAKLVPHSVVIRTQAASGGQRQDGALVISVYILHHAQGDEDVGVEGICLCGLVEEVGDLAPPGLVLILWGWFEAIHELLVLLMALDPHAQVAQRRELVELVGATHTQGQEAVQIVGVHLMTPAQALDGLHVLIQLRVELAQLAPALGALGVPLHFGLEGHESLAVTAFSQQLLGQGQGVVRVEVLVILLELVLGGFRAALAPDVFHAHFLVHPRLLHERSLALLASEAPSVLHGL